MEGFFISDSPASLSHLPPKPRREQITYTHFPITRNYATYIPEYLSSQRVRFYYYTMSEEILLWISTSLAWNLDFNYTHVLFESHDYNFFWKIEKRHETAILKCLALIEGYHW